MKTKKQKLTQIEEGAVTLKNAQSVVITDFTGLSANEMNTLRKNVFDLGGTMSVFKKRLLKYVFEKEGMEFTPSNFAGQAGVVFSPKDMVETAGVVYKFSKVQNKLKILGGFNVLEKSFISANDTKAIGQLPGREVLLGQLVYMLGTPIRSFMVVLQEKAKKS
ncbi:50S ribosomal protein L10 [Candidatus Parcubacteria bacterium]|jgi:large subunit ribosomal protein L10|nr:MAG: 50S ribosomal protein L10 [Candidatus Parcubacteria bacterium]